MHAVGGGFSLPLAGEAFAPLLRHQLEADGR